MVVKHKQIVSKMLKLRSNTLAHNLEAVGSIPTPATNDFSRLSVTDGLFFASFSRTLRVSDSAVLRHGTGCEKAPKMRIIIQGKMECIFLPPGPIPDGSQLMDRLTIN